MQNGKISALCSRCPWFKMLGGEKNKLFNVFLFFYFILNQQASITLR